HRRYDYERYEKALGQRDACCQRAKPSISQCSQRMLPCRKDFEPVRHVRFGSLADIKAWIRDVRFTPESGHSSERVGCPLSARTHAVQQTKTLFDHLVGAREQCRWFSRPS